MQIRLVILASFIISFSCFNFLRPSLKKNLRAKKNKNKSIRSSATTPPPVWLKPSSTWKKRPGLREEKKFVVIIMSYNNRKWYTYNLDSVFAQKYRNYRVIYVDDASSDGTGNFVAQYIQKKRQSERVTLICNEKRKTKTANVYKAVHMCDDNEIIVVLDGDDWFAHSDVLLYLNQIYTDNNIWMTYGGFKSFPSGKENFCVPIDKQVILENNFRKIARITSAQRSFYARLYKHIKLEDLMFEGKFMPMAGDVAKMYPMFEMAGHRFWRIKDVVYIYNRVTPINDDKVNLQLQGKINQYVLHKEKYSPLLHAAIVHSKQQKLDVISFPENSFSSDVIKDCTGDYVLLKRRDMRLDKNIDLLYCLRILDKTKAVALFFGVNKNIFEKNNFPYEQIESNICAWQFKYGPDIDYKNQAAVMLKKVDLLRFLQYPNELCSGSRIGLFYDHE